MNLETEKEAKVAEELKRTSKRVIVFDMDGTLYRLDGANNG